MIIQCIQFGCSAQSKSCSSPQTGLLTHSGSGASYTLTSEGRYEGKKLLLSVFDFGQTDRVKFVMLTL